MTAEERLRAVPWRALRGLAPALDAPLAEILGGAPVERILDRTLRSRAPLDAEQRAAIAEALFGVGVWRLRLQHHLGSGTTAPRPYLGSLVRDLGGLAEAEDLVGLAPGSLPPPRAPPDDLGTRYSFPAWLAAVLEAEVGAEAHALADALDRPGPVCLRPNLLRTTPDDLARSLAAEKVETRRGLLVAGALVVTSLRPNLHGLAAWRDGLFEVQDEASQLAGALVGARSGEVVLDLCAGAGGKTLLLADAVGPGGAVLATDPDARKLARLSRRASRAGAERIVRVLGASPPDALTVDHVLVDAPCSELGALRRGPDQRFRIDPATFPALERLQRELLTRGAAHVRRGGSLVYATCTFRRDEDEAVAEAFEMSHPSFVRTSERRTWPHREGCDGFYLTAWRSAGTE